MFSRLTRITESTQYVREIDGLRFFAIMWVIVFHIHVYTWVKLGLPAAPRDGASAFLGAGFSGVSLFFVISGFILAVPFARYHLGLSTRRVELRRYYLRRLTRLEPPFLVAGIVLATMTVLTGAYTWDEIAPHVVPTLTYTHGLVFGTASPFLGVAWSLEVEVQFYIVAPLLSAVFRLPTVPRRTLLVVAIAVLSVAMPALGFGEHHDARKHLLVGHLAFFLTGFLLADLYLTHPGAHERARRPGARVAWDVAGLAAFAALTPLSERHGGLWPLLTPACIALFYVAAFRGSRLRWFVSRPFVAVVGGMCYTVYLWHYAMISLLGRVLLPRLTGQYEVDVWAMMALLIPPILGVGAVLFAVLERPFMDSRWPLKVRAWMRGEGRSADARTAADPPR